MDHELILAQQSARIFGKDATYKPDDTNQPCRVVLDQGVDPMGSAPVRETVLTFLNSEIPKYEPGALVEVPYLGGTYRLNKLQDDDGYVRSVLCGRI